MPSGEPPAVIGEVRFPYIGGMATMGRKGAEVLLNARATWACPTCRGTGKEPRYLNDDLLTWTELTCYHTQAPTIGQLVAIGTAVITCSFEVKPMDPEELNNLSPYDAFWSGSDGCWNALREVK